MFNPLIVYVLELIALGALMHYEVVLEQRKQNKDN